MKRDHPETGYHRDDYPATNFVPGAEIGRFHMDKTLPDAGGADELLAAVGYKVRANEMADVAEKLLQLEMAMGCGQEDSVITHLAADTVHYNPSDINTWLETMLSEINSPALLPSSPAGNFHESSGEADSSTITTVDFPNARSYGSDCDLRAIPGDAVYADSGFRETKRMKPEQPVPEPALPVVVLDSQEAGIRLVHALMACAESVERNNLKDAESLLRQISLLAGSQAGAMRKVATCFAEALARRIFRFYPPKDPLNPSFSDMLERHMYEACPYLKFAHFTANQAILEAFAGKSHVHVIDFSMKQGLQWPALMQALALRPGGPPVFRLTGIGPPQPDRSDPLQEVGFNLARLAETMHVEFEYRGLVCSSLADLEPHMLHVRADVEAVAVNSVFELHRLLSRPGAIEKVLAAVKAVGPTIVTVVEQEANHNGPRFAERFNEALHYYSTVFDSVEGSGPDEGLTEVYLSGKICDVVACEGAERVERHERLDRWRGRMSETGFEAVHLGSNAFKQASTMLALFGGGEGYRVEERNGCLLLGWHTRPLIATSAWHVPQPLRR